MTWVIHVDGGLNHTAALVLLIKATVGSPGVVLLGTRDATYITQAIDSRLWGGGRGCVLGATPALPNKAVTIIWK